MFLSIRAIQKRDQGLLEIGVSQAIATSQAIDHAVATMAVDLGSPWTHENREDGRDGACHGCIRRAETISQLPSGTIIRLLKAQVVSPIGFSATTVGRLGRDP